MKKFSLLLTAALLSTPAWAYTTVTITEPASERVYLRPAETLEIKAEVSPKPSESQALIIKFDGEPVAVNADNAKIRTITRSPGEHIITAELQDHTGRVLASDNRKVHFVVSTLIMKEQREAAKAKAEYDALPWYKKALKKITPEKPKVQDTGFLTPATSLGVQMLDITEFAENATQPLTSTEQ